MLSSFPQSDVWLNERHDAMLGTCLAVLSKVHALRTSTHNRDTSPISTLMYSLQSETYHSPHSYRSKPKARYKYRPI